MSFKTQLTAAFNQFREWHNSPDPATYAADVALTLNLLSVEARREGAGGIIPGGWRLCLPAAGMDQLGRLLAWCNKRPVSSYTPPEAAKLLKMRRQSVLDLIRAGEIPAANLAKGSRPRYRISADDLQAFMRRRKEPHPVRKTRRPSLPKVYF